MATTDTPATPQHNLPGAPVLFGREADLEQVGAALAGSRLVTLVGPGGVGKTRLALAAAEGLLDAYPDGVWLVELAPLADPDLVPTAVATTLGVREQPGRALAESLADYLRDRALLLVLDNCEHLREACAALVGTLLVAAPGLRVLATSRAPLGLAAECRLAVRPLALPAPGETGPDAVAGTPAVALFVERARAVEPSFALDEGNAAEVAAICARLDGLPLAIELAAASIKVRSPSDLLAELGERLAVLVGGQRGLPARHRTVRGLLNWSYTLLGPGEQALFARLSVFAGGWTVEAAQAVCAIEDDLPMSAEEGLASLAEQSLVQTARGGRYTMLETVREYAAYALDRLSAEEDAQATRRQHLGYFLALAEGAAPHLAGAEQGAWLERLEAEHDNLRAALGWSLSSAAHGAAPEQGLRLAGALWRFWSMRGYFGEGRRWLEAVLAGGQGTPAARAKALNAAGDLAAEQGDFGREVLLQGEALALWRALGDRRGITASLNRLAWVASLQGDFSRAVALREECLALQRDLGDQWDIAYSLNHLGWVASQQGDYGRAAALGEESLALWSDLGDRWGIARAIGNLGLVAGQQGDFAQAAALHGETLALYRELGDRAGIAATLNRLGWVAGRQGDLGRAAALLEECLALQRDLGDRRGIARSLGHLGSVVGRQGDHPRALALLAESLRLSRDTGARDLLAEGLESLAQVEMGRGRPRRAAQLGAAAEALRATLGMALPSALQAGHDRLAQSMRAALGEAKFAAAWAEGRALSPEAAITLALDEATVGRQ